MDKEVGGARSPLLHAFQALTEIQKLIVEMTDTSHHMGDLAEVVELR